MPRTMESHLLTQAPCCGRLVRRREALLTAATLAWCAQGLALARTLAPSALAAQPGAATLMWAQRLALVERLAMAAVFFQARRPRPVYVHERVCRLAQVPCLLRPQTL